MHTCFLDSEFPDSHPEQARFHLIPVPLEHTVSYGGGTAGGPSAILEASRQLEKMVDNGSEPGRLGIHTYPTVDCSYQASVSEVFDRLASMIEATWELDSVPIILGGEHSVTNGAIRAIKNRFGVGRVGILQFDAHMDLRDTYQGSPYSHASVMYRAVEAGLRLFQVGIRNYSGEELSARKRFDVSYCDAVEINSLRLSNEGFKYTRLPSDFPDKLFISFDVDGFDASLMPATGTPDPGGFWWWEAIELLESLTDGRTIIGSDVVELAPRKLLPHCDYTTAKLTYHIMGLIARRNRFLHGHTSS